MSVVDELFRKAQHVQVMGNVEDVEREEVSKDVAQSGRADLAWARVYAHPQHHSDNSKGRSVQERCHTAHSWRKRTSSQTNVHTVPCLRGERTCTHLKKKRVGHKPRLAWHTTWSLDWPETHTHTLIHIDQMCGM